MKKKPIFKLLKNSKFWLNKYLKDNIKIIQKAK